jgi:hypothetical protein
MSDQIVEAKLIPVCYLVDERPKMAVATAITGVGQLGSDGMRLARQVVIDELLKDTLRIESTMLGILFNHLFADADPSQLATILCSKHAAALLHAIDLPRNQERIRDVAHNLQLKDAWADVEVPLGSWVEPLTSYAFGSEEVKRLKALRKEKEAERALEQAAAKEDEAATRSQAFVDHYRLDRSGVRLHQVSGRCLECGSRQVVRIGEGFGPNRECKDCGATWYVNHCWSCATGEIDSRDPETPACSVCKWYKCAKCHACKMSGCSTNPYSLANKAKDNRIEQSTPFEIDDSAFPF